MGNSRDREFRRWGVYENRSLGDGEFTRCGVQQMGNSRDRELRRWGVHQMGSSVDGKFTRWRFDEMES